MGYLIFDHVSMLNAFFGCFLEKVVKHDKLYKNNSDNCSSHLTTINK